MSFRSDSLHARLTEPQRDELMIAMMQARSDRADAGLKLCQKWEVQASRSAVHNFFARYNFGWRLERGAWVAKTTEGMSDFETEQKKLVAQKLFAEAADVDADPKFLLFLRGLELEQAKLDLATRSAETRFKLETEKLAMADRRVKLLEAKITKAREAVSAAKSKGGLTKETLKQIEETLGL